MKRLRSPLWMPGICALLVGSLQGCLVPEEDTTFEQTLTLWASAMPSRQSESGATPYVKGPLLEFQGTGSLKLNSLYARDPILPDSVPIVMSAHGHDLIVFPDAAFLSRTRFSSSGFWMKGFPCEFSTPTGYQWGPEGVGDTVTVVFSEIKIIRDPDTVRLLLVLDSAASMAANPRADVSGLRMVHAWFDVACEVDSKEDGSIYDRP